MGVILSSVAVNKTLRIQSKSGDVIRVIRNDDPNYVDFGEAYFSWVYPNIIKAWKKQKKQMMNLFVPVGSVRFILIDEEGKSMKVDLTEVDDFLLTIPPGIWYGFKCVSKTKSLVLNVADSIHDPETVERKPESFFSFSDYEEAL